MFPGSDKYLLGYKIMLNWEYTYLEETKPLYMVVGLKRSTQYIKAQHM